MKSKRAIGELILSGAVAVATGVGIGMLFNKGVAPVAQGYGLGATIALVVGTVLVGITAAFYVLRKMLHRLPLATKHLEEMERQHKEREGR